MNKKEIRQNFRSVCLKRDKNTCQACGRKAVSLEEALEIFDIHHIVDRHNFEFGGYVLENGIVLCKDSCHLKAEVFHSTGIAEPGFSIDELYVKINSSHELAIEADKKLGFINGT